MVLAVAGRVLRDVDGGDLPVGDGDRHLDRAPAGLGDGPVTVVAVPELVLSEPDDPVPCGAVGAATTVSLAVAGPDVEVW